MDVVEWTTREYNEWKGFIMCKHCQSTHSKVAKNYNFQQLKKLFYLF